jgi:hypothetical protein
MHAANATKSAMHYDNGTKLLREMFLAGEFEPISEQQRRAIAEFISFFGRSGAIRLLMAGMKWRSLVSYFREIPYQLHARRFKFLVFFPLLELIPNFVLRRRLRRPSTAAPDA